jgi:hypothetical protein
MSVLRNPAIATATGVGAPAKFAAAEPIVGAQRALQPTDLA